VKLFEVQKLQSANDIKFTSIEVLSIFESTMQHGRFVKMIDDEFLGGQMCPPITLETVSGKGKIQTFEGRILDKMQALRMSARLEGKSGKNARARIFEYISKLEDTLRCAQATIIDMAENDRKMLAITRINPNTMKAISSTRNNNQVRSNYLALVGVGILEEVTEVKKVTRYRFTVDGLDYSSGYYHGIPRFDDSKHSLIMDLIEEFAKKQLTAQSDLFIS
jgi:hypothetical protein